MFPAHVKLQYQSEKVSKVCPMHFFHNYDVNVNNTKYMTVDKTMVFSSAFRPTGAVIISNKYLTIKKVAHTRLQSVGFRS